MPYSLRKDPYDSNKYVIDETIDSVRDMNLLPVGFDALDVVSRDANGFATQIDYYAFNPTYTGSGAFLTASISNFSDYTGSSNNAFVKVMTQYMSNTIDGIKTIYVKSLI